jgi:hypothetical protein
VNSQLYHPCFIRGSKTLIIGCRSHPGLTDADHRYRALIRFKGLKRSRRELEPLPGRTLLEFRRDPWHWLDSTLLNWGVVSRAPGMGKALLM